MARIWVLGGGLIGCGWAVTFAGAGHDTLVIDPAAEAPRRLDAAWRDIRPALTRLGLLVDEVSPPRVVARAEHAGAAPDLVQECLPERLDLKRDALAALEPRLAVEAIIASSSSGLSPDAMQEGLAHPGRLLIAHPCNPPWLMPVVELCGGATTSADVMDRAEAFYASMGKTVLRMARPMPGHLVNRLQAALWREAVHLAREGVASLGDIECAVTLGLAPRWCLVGPSAVFHLAGAEGGMARFLDALGPEFERWWDSLGTPRLDPETRRVLVEGMAEADPRPVTAIAAARDAALPELLAFLKKQGTANRSTREESRNDRT
jgi:3-hydroxyacyl-CoA dehydrogenase